MNSTPDGSNLFEFSKHSLDKMLDHIGREFFGKENGYIEEPNLVKVPIEHNTFPLTALEIRGEDQSGNIITLHYFLSMPGFVRMTSRNNINFVNIYSQTETYFQTILGTLLEEGIETPEFILNELSRKFFKGVELRSDDFFLTIDDYSQAKLFIRITDPERIFLLGEALEKPIQGYSLIYIVGQDFVTINTSPTETETKQILNPRMKEFFKFYVPEIAHGSWGKTNIQFRFSYGNH